MASSPGISQKDFRGQREILLDLQKQKYDNGNNDTNNNSSDNIIKIGRIWSYEILELACPQAMKMTMPPTMQSEGPC